MAVIQSILIFAVAGVFEIAGGWLIWKAVREGKPLNWALWGGLILLAYGFIPTLQASHFSRVYAVYGGVFIVMSLLWGKLVDGTSPDAPDLAGALIALLGVAVMMYWPR